GAGPAAPAGGAATYLELWDRRAGARAGSFPNVVIRSPASMSPAAASLQHHPQHQHPQTPTSSGHSPASASAGGATANTSLWSAASGSLSELSAGAFPEAQSPAGPVPRTSSASAGSQMSYGPSSASPHPGQRGLLRTSSLNTKKSAPNRVCCNALLAAYARATPTQWQRAIRLLELMWQIGGELCPDIVSYNTVIKACGNAGQVELGFKVYALMRRRGIEPTVATYGTLVCIAADAGASARVIEVWGWLRTSGLEVHVTCANAYLSALIKQGEWESAVSFFRSLLRPGGPCRPNTITFNTLMAGYLERRQPEQVLALFQELQGGCGLAPSVTSYNHLVSAYGMLQRWEDAFNVVAFVCRPDSTVRPNVAMFANLFAELKETAEAAAASATSGDSSATAAAATTLLGLSRYMHDLRALLKMYPHLHPDTACHRAMIGAFAAVGEVDICVELFNVLLLMAVHPPPTPPTPPTPTSTSVVAASGGGTAGASTNSFQAQIKQSGKSGDAGGPDSQQQQQQQQSQSGVGLGHRGDGSPLGEVYGAAPGVEGQKLQRQPPPPVGLTGAVDAVVASQVLGAICMHRAWDKAVQLLKVLQEHGPQLGAPVLRTVLEAMAMDRVWTAVYSVLQTLCRSGSGSSVLEELVVSFKEGGCTELLFLALLAAKDEAGAWAEAVSMFSWLQQVSGRNTTTTTTQQQQQLVVNAGELVRSPDLYRIMYEVLVIRGGVEGLRHAIRLCREAHEEGILNWYNRPEAQASAAASAGGAPSVAVVLEGYSRIETIVTLLSWLLEVQRAAASNILLPGPWVDILTPDSGEAGTSPGATVLDGDHVRPAIFSVLEGGIGTLLGVTKDSRPEHRALFPLLRAVRAYPGSTPTHPGIIRIQTESIYEAMKPEPAEQEE
ncbi:hypothetical protein Vretifemale_15433, partial [Volvox reticuliferus]